MKITRILQHILSKGLTANTSGVYRHTLFCEFN